VAERGAPDPPVTLYSWPELDVVADLKGGSSHSYSCMSFRYEVIKLFYWHYVNIQPLLWDLRMAALASRSPKSAQIRSQIKSPSLLWINKCFNRFQYL